MNVPYKVTPVRYFHVTLIVGSREIEITVAAGNKQQARIRAHEIYSTGHIVHVQQAD